VTVLIRARLSSKLAQLIGHAPNFLITARILAAERHKTPKYSSKYTACKGENASRGSSKVALTPALWERIVEIEAGLPKPPAGHQTVCNLHADDRRTSFVVSAPQYAASLDGHFFPHFCSSAAKRSIPPTESEPG
jgi:hypothetical protein